MAKQEVQRTFTFVNPNTPKEFEQQLQKILIDKLLSRLEQKEYEQLTCYPQKGASGK